MLVQSDNLKVGDRLRFSTELLEQFEDDPQHHSQLVEIVRIEEDVLDGTKTVYLASVAQCRKS